MRFKYERLSDLYFNCGELGHVVKGCSERKNQHSGYDTSLRTSPASSWGCSDNGGSMKMDENSNPNHHTFSQNSNTLSIP